MYIFYSVDFPFLSDLLSNFPCRKAGRKEEGKKKSSRCRQKSYADDGVCVFEFFGVSGLAFLFYFGLANAAPVCLGLC